MKTYFFLISILLISTQLRAQNNQDSIAKVVDSIATIELMDQEMMYAPVIDPNGTWAAEAIPEQRDYYYNKFNVFNYNYKAKIVAAPDKRAYYPGGSNAMFTYFSNHVNVPYQYGGSKGSYIVIIRVVVGKDSLLYNPEILSTPSSNYSVNAQSVIEGLPMRFVPAMKNGKAVDSYLFIPVRFESKSRESEYDNE